MATTKADMNRLIVQRDQLLREIEALRNKVSGIEMAIALLDGDVGAAGGNGAKPSVKAVLLDLLRDVGTTGLNSATAVEMASKRGFTLHAGSVSSTLSRFKRDEIVKFDGDKYRLMSFAPREEPGGLVTNTWSPRVVAAT